MGEFPIPKASGATFGAGEMGLTGGCSGGDGANITTLATQDVKGKEKEKGEHTKHRSSSLGALLGLGLGLNHPKKRKKPRRASEGRLSKPSVTGEAEEEEQPPMPVSVPQPRGPMVGMGPDVNASAAFELKSRWSD